VLGIVTISTELLTINIIEMAEPKLEVNGMELIQLKLQSNQLIKQHRKSIGLETPNNRIDQGDLRCVLSALTHLGFSITGVTQRSEQFFALLRYTMPDQFTDVALKNIVKGFIEQSK
tara:strand:+ start:2420 stop:2770 length:351 start_codon:yes stop_codon:yes gene_type:complete